MKLDRAWLTPAERQQRVWEGLCIYCGHTSPHSPHNFDNLLAITIQPLVIPSPNSPALLCLPWLKFHSQWEYFLSLPLPTISHRSW